MINSKKGLFILSIVVALAFSFILGIGIRSEGQYRIFGFPADWLGYYGDGAYGFMSLGLLFNVAFFYFLFVVLNKLLRKMIVKRNI